MPPADATRLCHMRDAIGKVQTFLHGRQRSDLDTDEMLALAVVRLLEVIGEAAKAVSADVKDAHPSVPWRLIGRTRDRLIHGYFNVDLDIVWQIATTDLPPLADELDLMLAP